MADWIYCATAGQVNAENTQSLLRSHRAIWCPPPGMFPWPGTPQPGERLWLVWRQLSDAEPTALLGGGRVLAAPRQLFGTSLLWTNPDVPGLYDAAVDLGYAGPTSMSFLRLDGTVFPAEGQPEIAGLGQLSPGLNTATEQQAEALAGVLPIP
jgi:hypothetical protein